MIAILVILYSFYFLLVGLMGNAQQFLSLVSGEKQFLYWALVLMVIAALWQSPAAEKLAKASCFLIVIGWLLHQNNGQSNAATLGANLKAILPAA